MDGVNERFLTLVAETRDERLSVRQKVAEGRWTLAEPDARRAAAYFGRKARVGGESLQGPTDDLQRADFLDVGARVRRAVAFIEVVSGGKAEVGSGFLISPDLLLTNQHVIEDVAAARGARVTFDFEILAGGYRPTSVYSLDPDRFALFCNEDNLDYALIAVGERVSGDAALGDLGFCPLSDTPDRHAVGMNVNIIQHPGGRPKMIAVRNNVLTHRTARTLLYETDTENGSSGSPVFNDEWDVVALHHYGHPFLETVDETGVKIPTAVNEGVRISTIHRHLAGRTRELKPEAQALLRSALEPADRKPVDADRTLSPPRPARGGESRVIQPPGPTMSDPATPEFKLTVPLEITVRLGGTGASTVVDTKPAGTIPTDKVLLRGAEKLVVDPDYGERTGYQRDFIAGVILPLPTLDDALAKQIAAIKETVPGNDPGELRYEHFSVVMHRTRRLAIFTATNIDGATYLNIDRDTGRPMPGGGEGETWYRDPRISSNFTVEQPFYSAWSLYFDRGHLTRRTDVTWGDEETSVRANADTYHFTNCTPQHFLFNQGADYWQGAERYVLENGALDKDHPARITVFQGPIFNDTIDRWADDLQVPSSFFKVIVWRGEGGLKAVGLIGDQALLMDVKRKGGSGPQQTPPRINQWRVGLKAIEARTGLVFCDAIRKADTITSNHQPRAGEAQILLTGLDGILA